MNLLHELRARLDVALTDLAPSEDRPLLLDMVRRSQDVKFGDYQANCAMPLAKKLARPPRDVAAEIAARLSVDDLCHPPEIAGPGFLNLRVRDDWLAAQLARAVADPRLGVTQSASPRKIVLDFSAPNVAKPMHVGHIRSTVIGDALCRTLRFLGHEVTSDNHLGDWGTQFGMIIYGYKHFLDRPAYESHAVDELARLYRLVNQIVDYHEGRRDLPRLEQAVVQSEQTLANLPAPAAVAKANVKAAQKERKQIESRLADAREQLAERRKKQAAIENSPALRALAEQHPTIGQSVLEETARLHEGDAENRRLWEEFLPPCREALESTYRRLNVTFDETLGESFYHDRLAAVVKDLLARNIAVPSEGAICVFLEGRPAPMLIQKQDGAYLYATTDLATIQYRRERWSPDSILYVVDHRQSLHFEQLFAAARRWGYDGVELTHIAFGTVLGDDGRPYKTRSGDTVGLSGLLDEAESRAYEIVSRNDDGKPGGAELDDVARRRIAATVGIAALKYADLSQNRTSDYTFSYEKMLAMTGNTATYMQYAYARVRSIFAKGNVDVGALRQTSAAIGFTQPIERALGLKLVQFEEALEQTIADYRPNQLTSYLFELAETFSTFFQECPVLKAESDALRTSRLLLCDLTARTIAKGLELLGIQVVDKM